MDKRKLNGISCEKLFNFVFIDCNGLYVFFCSGFVLMKINYGYCILLKF